jgi:hypothetical protein
LLQRVEQTWLEIGVRVWYIRHHRLYAALGYPHFNAYLSSPELSSSRTSLYRAVQVAEAFIPALRDDQAPSPRVLEPLIAPDQLARIGIVKASKIAALVQAHPEQAESWVARAETQTAADLDLGIREQQEPTLSQLQMSAHELGTRLAAMAYQLRGTHHDPMPILEELIATAVSGKEYLLKVQRNGSGPVCRQCAAPLPDYSFTTCAACFQDPNRQRTGQDAALPVESAHE